MKVYGWEDFGVARGEMVATNVDTIDLDWGLEALAIDLGWDRAFTSFKEAQRILVGLMRAESTDEELIQSVRQLKACHVPEV